MPFLNTHKQINTHGGQNIKIRGFLYSSHDKEHDSILFLQTGVSMAKLWPSCFCNFFMRYFTCNCTKFLFYTEDCSMRHCAGFSQIGSHLVLQMQLNFCHWSSIMSDHTSLLSDNMTLVLPNVQ